MSAPERRPAAILGAELRNFTRMSEALPALEMARRSPLLIYGVLLENRLDFT
jgi:class 3 adenylate cyclase